MFINRTDLNSSDEVLLYFKDTTSSQPKKLEVCGLLGSMLSPLFMNDSWHNYDITIKLEKLWSWVTKGYSLTPIQIVWLNNKKCGKGSWCCTSRKLNKRYSIVLLQCRRLEFPNVRMAPSDNITCKTTSSMAGIIS